MKKAAPKKASPKNPVRIDERVEGLKTKKALAAAAAKKKSDAQAKKVKVNVTSVRSFNSDVARKSKQSPVVSLHQRDLAKVSAISADRRGKAKGMNIDERGARNLSGKAFERTMKSFKMTPVKKKGK